MTFHNPLLILLLPLAVAIIIFAQRRRTNASLRFSSGELLNGAKSSWKVVISRRMYLARSAALAFLIIALMRPQSPVADSQVETEGVDIVLTLDASTSMLAEDFSLGGKRQNRLAVVKRVVEEFIRGRGNDRIALVTFGARAYTVCPLTLDYDWLLVNLERIQSGMVEDGTAIGSGIASSINRLKNSQAKSKIIILLTDGRNNSGKIAPLAAAQAAAALKIKIYTIGAGSKGLVPYPVKDVFGNTGYQNVQIDIDEETLTKIAAKTKAKYFRATDTESLRKIYSGIDKMEKTIIQDKGYREFNELFGYFLVPGLALLLLEVVLSNTVLRKIP